MSYKSYLLLVVVSIVSSVANAATDCSTVLNSQSKVDAKILDIEINVPVKDRKKCFDRLTFQVDSTPVGAKIMNLSIENALTEGKKADLKKEIENKSQAAESKEDFAALGFGLGVGYSFGVGGDRVKSAEVIDGIVRVTSDNTNAARIFAEAHWLFTPWSENIGFGPFVSINSGGSASGFTSFGLGGMIAFRDKSNKSANSWNLGIGFIMDSDVQVLGDGISEGQPLPGQEEGVRYKTESKGAITVMFSRGFGF